MYKMKVKTNNMHSKKFGADLASRPKKMIFDSKFDVQKEKATVKIRRITVEEVEILLNEKNFEVR